MEQALPQVSSRKQANRSPGRSSPTRKSSGPRTQQRGQSKNTGRSRSRRQTISTEHSGTSASQSKMKWIIICVLAVVVVGGVVAGVVLGSPGSESPAAAETGNTDTKMTSSSNWQGSGSANQPNTNSGASVKMISYNESFWKGIRGDCGIPRVQPDLVSSRIVGGTEATKHSWSWQISLVKFKDYGKGYHSISHTCGGTLVAPRFVISATHCFLNALRTQVTTKPDNYRVIVGGHDKSKISDGAKLVKISSIIHHPKNNLATFSRQRKAPEYDLSVLKLEQAFNPTSSTPKISFACLPTPGVVPPAQKRCWVTGWGKTLNTGFDKVLKQAPQVVVSQAACNKYYGQISYEKHLCVQQKSMGTCQGDSGGPLVCQGTDNKWTLYGATSFGPTPCAIAPSVFANLPMMLEWACCYMDGYGPCERVRCTRPT